MIIKKPVSFTEYNDKILNHIHKLNEMMLKDFIEICEENDIEYFLAYGTLLGAIRHEGFIPWDDDIDLFMFRDQHDKLIKVMNENPSDKYDFLSLKNQEYYCRIITLMNLKGTKAEKFFDLNSDFTLGFSMDIFVLDNMPSNPIKQKYFILKQKFYKKLLFVYEVVHNDFYISKNKERLGKIIKVFFKIFGIDNKTIKKLAYNLINYCDESDDEFVCDLDAFYGIRPLPRKWFSDSKKVKFESLKATIPIGYEEFLKAIYGDYMKLPPEEERRNHMFDTVDFGPYQP